MTGSSAMYAGKTILAPMVKIGTLPTRILALRHGAHLVYSEEIVDWRFLKGKRFVNEMRNTIDYIDGLDGSVFFQTCEEERGKVILQIGTADAKRALRVAQMTQQDVAGIDINMGCPKEFSLKGGMGAALLSEPTKIESILKTLVSNLSIPVTCKIRVLPNLDDTLSLCKLIESCGVAAIGIHGRTRFERRQHPNRNHFIKEIASQLKIPVIANGGSLEIKKFEDIEAFRKETGSSSVMIARAAEWNASIFSPKEKDIHDIIREFLRLAVDFDLAFPQTKYAIQMMMRDMQASDFGQEFLSKKLTSELCDLWCLSEYYQNSQAEYAKKLSLAEKRHASDPLLPVPDPKKLKIGDLDDGEDEGECYIVPGCRYLRGLYTDTEDLPKSVLLAYARMNQFSMPFYESKTVERRFRAQVTLGGQKFRTDLWEKSRKAAEQAAAMACIKYLDIKSLKH